MINGVKIFLFLRSSIRLIHESGLEKSIIQSCSSHKSLSSRLKSLVSEIILLTAAPILPEAPFK